MAIRSVNVYDARALRALTESIDSWFTHAGQDG
jgi:hypothetical protein